MSNERIDQILYENNLEYAHHLYPNMHPRIINAMEQYGKEQYQKGRMDQEKVENFKLGLQSDELSRLRKLVQAQKELIDRGDFHEYHTEVIELRNKIKELEA